MGLLATRVPLLFTTRVPLQRWMGGWDGRVGDPCSPAFLVFRFSRGAGRDGN
jgi:hypothetical protein